MLVDKNSMILGGDSLGTTAPGALSIGSRPLMPTETIFIQNDSNKSPTSPWYVTQVDSTHYTMLNATAPKGWQYLGAFLVSGETGAQTGRADGAVWTLSNTSMVQHITTSAKGQAAISILTAGTCILTVTLRDMISTLVITAVDAS